MSDKEACAPSIAASRADSGFKCLSRGQINERDREAARDGDKLDQLPWDAREPERDPDVTGAREEQTQRTASPRASFRAEHLPVMSEVLAAHSPCERNALLTTGDGDYSKSRAEAAEQLGENQNTFRSHLKRRPRPTRRRMTAPRWRGFYIPRTGRFTPQTARLTAAAPTVRTKARNLRPRPGRASCA